MIEIPLTSHPHQLFSIVLGGEVYECMVMYNTRVGVWTISFSQSGTELAGGIPLLGGVDIMKQLNLEIGPLYVININDSAVDASASDLGDAVRLVVIASDELTDG